MYFETKKEIEVDLINQKINCGNKKFQFKIDSFQKKCLLEGLDDIDLSFKKIDQIKNFEIKLKQDKPWI